MKCVSVFLFKQKTAYEMRISDWSSDVCSSDLAPHFPHFLKEARGHAAAKHRRINLKGVIVRVIKSQPVETERDMGLFKRTLFTPVAALVDRRSEARRVGKECVSTCRSRWSPFH